MGLDYKVKTLRRLFGPGAFFRGGSFERTAHGKGGGGGGSGGGSGGTGSSQINAPTAYLRAAALRKVTKGGNGVPRPFFSNVPPRLLKGKTIGKHLFTMHLLEKQKMRVYYGAIRDKMFHKYVDRARTKRFNSDAMLIRSLETRLDTVLYRSGLVQSAMQARHWVAHGHVLVNGEVVKRRCTALTLGDVVHIAEDHYEQALESAEKAAQFRIAVDMGPGWVIGDKSSQASWLETDRIGLAVALVRPPSDDECRLMTRAALVPYIKDAQLNPHQAMRAYR